jgi:type II secretory pathway pseudopilin PulG
MVARFAGSGRRSGITLTEILIAILILGVGLASVATLFPLGLLRLRDAARSTRSAYLTESAAADLESRGLLTSTSFSFADQYNILYNTTLGTNPWFTTVDGQVYNPLIQDTPGPASLVASQDWITNGTPPTTVGANSGTSGGYGLPFAYDPLWRFQTANPNSLTNSTQGYYLNDNNLEARFGAGLGYIRTGDPDGNLPSAHGLQRLTNFNRPFVQVGNNAPIAVMPVSNDVPRTFVSPEDVVWQEATNPNYFLGGNGTTRVGNNPSTVVPDLSIVNAQGLPSGVQTNDWHYSWMFTGQQNNASSGSTFDGNIVIFENRPFGIVNTATTSPNPPGGTFQSYQVDGETVVEAIWGYSTNVSSAIGGPGYGAGADRSVLLRWYNTQNDPVVKVGDWIADVTYERNATVVATRFGSFGQVGGGNAVGGLQNPFNKLEWDNLPAQRCFWYRVQKVMPAGVDTLVDAATYRSMVVYVDRTLQARTPLTAGGSPVTLNAALISPYVVNVIPQTIFTN